MTDNESLSRLHSVNFPDDAWEELQDVARDEGRRIKRIVSASEVIRDGTVREVKRLRKRLDASPKTANVDKG